MRVKHVKFYPICKSYQWWKDKEAGGHADFGAEECWDQPDSTIPKFSILRMWKKCFLTETDTGEDVTKFLMKKATSDSTGNSPQAAELQAAQLAQLTQKQHNVISFVFAVEMIFALSLV